MSSGGSKHKQKDTDKMTHPRGIFERPPNSNVWWVNYFEHGRRHRERVGPRSLAIAVYQKRKTEIREGHFFPPGPRRHLTLQTLAEQALKAKELRNTPYSVRMDRIRLKRLLEHFGSITAAGLTSGAIEEFMGKLASVGRSGATLNQYRSLLSSFYTFGLRTALVSVNPVARVPRARVSPGRIRFLDAKEEARLRRTLDPLPFHCEAELDLSLNTGLRRGEQFALRWDKVDLKRGLLTVARGKTGLRHIPLNSAARRALSVLRRYTGQTPFVCPYAHGQLRDWRRWFEAAVRRAKLTDFHWHDLRHTFASRLVMAGVDLASVQALLGHKTVQMTLRYAHLAPAHLKRAVDALCDGLSSHRGARRATISSRQDSAATKTGSRQLVPLARNC
jgi:site-specific recombinase XerD